ncbi:META domain-containing protein [Flavobacterium sp. SUN052]|uniref:META domain-containing protein n=1 Tax=Flavobacterium sp. SUN052 TaxID=3002441 RepID=UPI00237E8574|nr:META domain-containing protein [Flavobacterium sp. SUN052]MEC4005373.1 META domain-containing protein [Flavobacterium sp. SUN052]
MKKSYLIIAVAFLSIVGCQKKETEVTNTSADSIQQADTTSVADMKNDTTTTTTNDSSDVELLNKMKTTTKTIENDPSKGKYALAETKWKLVELNGKAVKSTSDKDYFINLDSKSGKFAAFAGCNSIMGTFVMKAATKLAFLKIATTKMACQDSKTEMDFVKALEKVDNYMIEGTMLHFHKGNSNAVAKFEAIK